MRIMFIALLLPTVGVGTVAAQAHRPGAGAALHAPASPQPTGFMLNAHTVAAFGTSAGDATQLDDHPITTGMGPGGGVQVGYAFNRTVMVFASADIAKQSSTRQDLPGNLGLTHIDLGARVNVPVHSSRVLPYAMASVERRSLGTNVQDDVTGAETKVSSPAFRSVSGVAYSTSCHPSWRSMPASAWASGSWEPSRSTGRRSKRPSSTTAPRPGCSSE